MNYGRYNRSVIVLSEQGREFAAAASPISGYLKVETGNNKGAMRCSVENMRPYSKGEYIYKLILFGTRNERTIYVIIGTVPVGRSGNGEAYFRFNPLDVDGRGNGYECFTTAIVASVSTKSDQEPLHPVLKGDTGNEVPEPASVWAASAEPEQPQEPEGQEIAESPEKSESPQEPVGPEGLRGPGATSKSPEVKNYNGYYNEHILNACHHTCQMAEYYEEVRPFSADKTGARWKKITNVMNLPLVSPGAHYFAGLYQHYLFGAKADEKGFAVCYFFGIPGRKLAAEQPDEGLSGFVYWQPMKGMEDQKAPYGYWIVEIDGETGDILEVFIEKADEV